MSPVNGAPIAIGTPTLARRSACLRVCGAARLFVVFLATGGKRNDVALPGPDAHLDPP